MLNLSLLKECIHMKHEVAIVEFFFCLIGCHVIRMNASLLTLKRSPLLYGGLSLANKESSGWKLCVSVS